MNLENARIMNTVTADLADCRTLEAIQEYASSNLKLIGIGYTRKVYKINDECVLKVPLDTEHAVCNIREYTIYETLRSHLPLAKVLAYDELGLWEIMEYAREAPIDVLEQNYESLAKRAEEYNIFDVAEFNTGMVQGMLVLIDYAA